MDQSQVKNLIEQCMQLYMSKHEVLKFLSEKLGIEPGVTTLVWQKLEEEYTDFFQVYYTRLRLKKQILYFNDLLEKQYNLMEYQKCKNVPLAQQNLVLPVNNVPVAYPALQQHLIPAADQPLIGYTTNMSDCHAVNGILEMSDHVHPLQILGNNMMMDGMLPINPTGGIKAEMMVAEAGQFHFTSPDISGQSIDNSVLDSTFVSDISAPEGLALESDGGTGMYGFQTFSPVAWDSSFNDPNPELLPNLEGVELFVETVPDLGTRRQGNFQCQ